MTKKNTQTDGTKIFPVFHQKNTTQPDNNFQTDNFDSFFSPAMTEQTQQKFAIKSSFAQPSFNIQSQYTTSTQGFQAEPLRNEMSQLFYLQQHGN